MVHLHVHDDHSNLRLIDSINKIKKLIEKAVKMKNSGIALTDHESISGHVEALQLVERGKAVGDIPQDFKLILGNEIYLVNSLEEVKDNYKPGVTKFWHFILLAKDEIGHKQLRILSSLAWDNSFKTGKMERVPTLKSDLERIVKENPGHLIASTACLGGESAHWILNKNAKKFNEFVQYCFNLFGEDFYFEIQPNNSEEQVLVNKTLINISNQLQIPVIVTCDVHYLNQEDRVFHEAYLNSHEEEREVGDFYATTYLMTEEEIHEYLDWQIGEHEANIAINNTDIVANKVSNYTLAHTTIVPGANIPNYKEEHYFKEYYDTHKYIKKFAYSSNKYDRYLLHLITQGFKTKGYYVGITNKELLKLIDRIEIELSEMWKVTEKIKNSISSYYISTLELIEIMWNEGDSLVGVARGSVTGMYTMYLIGLTQMNPVQWGLPHWRHISHEKAELSDVDIDTQRNRRKQIIEAVKKQRGERKVLNCCTFKTEGSKSAILTAARGLGVDNDIAQRIANLIPITRGATWSIHDCLYGNEEEDRKTVKEFVNEVQKIPNLLETALNLEGLISGRSIHASAVYLYNDDFTEHNARMRAPNGTYITQFNMHDSDWCGGLKMDFLTISSLDCIRHCMELLIEAGHMEWQGTLRDTYNKYLHPDVLDYKTEEMWNWVAENKVIDLFQFDTMVGLQAAKRIKPHSLVELATANSIMRLMVTDGEQPIDTYIRYKNNISEWYKCMREDYHLTEKEIKVVEPYLLPVYGVGDTQEIVMELSMDKNITNFSVADSNKLRKSISKKQKELQQKMKKTFYETGEQIGTSENLLNYIWHEIIGKQLGYSFSKNHTFPYSCIGVQELNLAYHYPIIYWNTACLIVDAGADEEIEENKSTDYGKIATAISNMQKRDIPIALPFINQAHFGFSPDEKNNRIIYALKAINGIGDDVVRILLENRPYLSMNDFYERMIKTKLIKNSQMLQLIKAGVFDELSGMGRIELMKNYISSFIVDKCNSLGMQQFNRLIELNEKYQFMPQELQLAIKHVYFKKYVLDDYFLYKKVIIEGRKIPKIGYHDRLFKLDATAMKFFIEFYSENSVVDVVDQFYVVSEKKFEKENLKNIKPLKDWLSKESTLNTYNNYLLQDAVEEYAAGTLSKWEMDSLSIYATTEHELASMNDSIYGIENFFDMPEEPEVYDTYIKKVRIKEGEKYRTENKEFPKYKITRIAGTILDKNKDKHTITLLTKTGVVIVKFNKGQFVHYDQQISSVNENGDKKVLEKSWFKRGNKIVVCGYRQNDVFRAYKYADTVYKHSCMLIKEVRTDGSIQASIERLNINE